MYALFEPAGVSVDIISVRVTAGFSPSDEYVCSSSVVTERLSDLTPASWSVTVPESVIFPLPPLEYIMLVVFVVITGPSCSTFKVKYALLEPDGISRLEFPTLSVTTNTR